MIASGVWAEGGTWQIVPIAELPLALAERPDLCTAVGVVALHDPTGSGDLPEVVMTLRNQGRNGERPRYEIASGKVDEGEHQDLEFTGRRETMEESGVALGALAAFACRISDNPPGSKFPGLSYMKYFVGFTEGEVGTPTEGGHSSQAMTLERIGFLARIPAEIAEAHNMNRIDPSEAMLIRAALVAEGYSKQRVYAAMGPLEL